MAKSNKLSIVVSDSIGKVSGLINEAPLAHALLVLAHGAGAGMTHAFMSTLANSLAEHGVTSIRFNFPYLEKGRGRPDPPAIAEKTVAMVIEKAHSLFPALPLFAGGKSFGGRMTSQLLSRQPPASVRGAVFFGFPLHAIGNPSTDRAEHLRSVKVPMLFHQGTRDKLAEIDMIAGVVKKLRNATLIRYEGADHSFKAGKETNIERLAMSTAEWMGSL